MKTVPLGEVAEIVMGQAPPGSSYNEDRNGLPLIAGAGDFKNGLASSMKFTSKPTKVSLPGDIILSIRASIGATVWADQEYCLGRGVAALRPKSRLDRKYLWHWLGYSAQVLAGRGRGATFLQVNRHDIGEMAIPLPPLPEQRRIAAILDQADAIRTKRRRVLAHLDSLTQSIFHSMFGDPARWSERWPMTTIGDLCVSTQYGTSQKAGNSGSWPVLRMGNVTFDGHLNLADLKYMDLPEDDVEKYTVRHGDILFNRTNSLDQVGKTCVVDTDKPLAFAGYLVRARVKESASPEFIAAYLTSPYGRSLRRKLAKAAVNQANINATQFRSIQIAEPPAQSQHEYANAIHAIYDKAANLRVLMTADDELFASLQSRAFSGEL